MTAPVHKNWNQACKVYIGNLGGSTSEQDLDLLFSEIGPVKNVWISPRKHKRYGFVEYEDAEDADQAVHDLNGKLLGDNCIRVEMSTSGCKLPDPHSGYLGGVHTDDCNSSWIYKSDRVAAYSVRGSRKKMEDRFVILENFNNTGVSIFAVFDGHGGEFAVKYASEHLINSLKEMVTEIRALVKGENDSSKSRFLTEELKAYLDDNNMINFKKIFEEAIPRIDQLLLQAANRDAECRSDCGTTALIAVMEKNQLTVANVGDSRGVMCDGRGNVVPLSFDHKPQNELEKKRIEEAGGVVTYDGATKVYRTGGLTMSRALGHYKLKVSNVIIANPDVTSFNLANHKPRCIILASDGLWDVYTNEPAVTYVTKWIYHNETNFGAKNIALKALDKGSSDNITVIVINLSKHDWSTEEV